MSTVCRRVFVDLSASPGSSLTIRQPEFILGSDRETAIKSGLTDRAFIANVQTLFRVIPATSKVTVNGTEVAPATDVDLAADGWLELSSLDTSAVIAVTPGA